MPENHPLVSQLSALSTCIIYHLLCVGTEPGGLQRVLVLVGKPQRTPVQPNVSPCLRGCMIRTEKMPVEAVSSTSTSGHS